MAGPLFSHEQLLRAGKLQAEDLVEIDKRRREHNRLGFAYQLAFVRLSNRFPGQQPFEIIEELLHAVALQLSIAPEAIATYQQRQPTMAEHRRSLLAYLHWRRFGATEAAELEAFLFTEACRLEQPGPLLVQAKQFLRSSGILLPADDTLQRLIITQRQAARSHIFHRLAEGLTDEIKAQLEAFLEASGGRQTAFQMLERPTGKGVAQSHGAPRQ